MGPFYMDMSSRIILNILCLNKYLVSYNAIKSIRNKIMHDFIRNSTLPFNKMTFNGKGEVTAVPDVAVIRLGVETTGHNLEVVQSRNTAISQNILNALRLMGISEIKTIQYRIEKIYNYENNTRIDQGYSVRNIYEIKLDNMNGAGKVIDTAVSQGANVVEAITFEVSNMDFYYEQALNTAVMNTIQKAKSVSNQLSVPINPIPIRITENSSVAIPFQTTYQSREIAMTTPVEPGTLKINASVTAEFIY